jgi:nitrate reductase NapE component
MRSTVSSIQSDRNSQLNKLAGGEEVREIKGFLFLFVVISFPLFSSLSFFSGHSR